MQNYSAKLMVLFLFIVYLLFSLFDTVQAETLFGKNFVGGSLGIIKFGDDFIDEVFGPAYTIEVVGNINLISNIDLGLEAAYAWADGEYGGIEADATLLGGGAGLIYFFRLNEQVNPYIRAGFIVAKTEIEVSGLGQAATEDDTATGFQAGAGVELEFTEKVLFRVGLDYVHFDIEDEDGTDLTGLWGYWFNEQVLGSVDVSYDFDSEDIVVETGLIFKL